MGGGGEKLNIVETKGENKLDIWGWEVLSENDTLLTINVFGLRLSLNPVVARYGYRWSKIEHSFLSTGTTGLKPVLWVRAICNRISRERRRV